MNLPILETERLILKRGSFDDYVKVYEYDFTKLRDIASEFEFVKLYPEDIKGYNTYMDENDGVFDWIIYIRDNSLPIGNVIADREVKDIKAITLAFNLHPDYWGCGYMKEAVVEVLEYLFNKGYDNVLCGYSEGNNKSKRVNEKIGFELYRVIKDAWSKNGVSITDYETIISKERFYQLYGNSKKN